MKKKGYWTYEKCKIEALKYNNTSKLQKNNSTVLGKIYKKGWLELLKHINPDNGDKRCIYVYEFENNYVYIGLTKDLKIRRYRHNQKGTVYNFVKKTKLKSTIKQLTDYIDENDAKKKEQEILELYKNNNWIILNKIKTGSLGSPIIKWTYDKCKKEALKYETRTHFQKNSKGAYLSAWRNNSLDEMCKHMIIKKVKNGYWNNYNKCKEEALKYKNRSEFHDKSWSAYDYSKKNRWIIEFFPI